MIGPLLPTNKPGARRTDDRRISSGIVHVLKAGCRWQDCPAVYGPPTTIHNRFHRWSARGIWQRLFDATVRIEGADRHLIDSTTAKAHRSAGGGTEGPRQRKGGPMPRPSVARAAVERQKSMLLSMVAAVPSPSN